MNVLKPIGALLDSRKSLVKGQQRFSHIYAGFGEKKVIIAAKIRSQPLVFL